MTSSAVWFGRDEGPRTQLASSSLQTSGGKGSHHKKKTKKFGKNSLMEVWGQNKKIKSQFQFGNFEDPGGGLNFSKMSQS